jgi:hypothetical protein
MILTANNETCVARVDKGQAFGKRLMGFLEKVAGRKNFTKDGSGYWFETSQRNIEYWLEAFPECTLVDARQKSKVNIIDQSLFGNVRKPRPPFQIVKQPYAHQTRGFEKTKDLTLSALFMGTGTGKTKVSIDKAVYLWSQHLIDALLILTKKGVHEQWVDEQLPEHIHESIPYVAHAWEGFTTVREKQAFDKVLNASEKLRVFSINLDAISSKNGFNAVMRFIKRAGGRVYAIVDESQDAKDPESNRGQTLQEIRDECLYRSVLSGTPIGKNLEDVWGQFHFLDTDIIGHEYKTPFRAEYCKMGGFQGKAVVGHKDLEKFYGRIDSVTFRATKEDELDLPEKLYERKAFKLTTKQQAVYDKLKKEFIVRLENDATVTVDHAATMVMRLQQIACGFVVDEDGTTQKLDNPRIDLLESLDDDIGRKEKKIVWCRFKEDYVNLKTLFGSRAVDYVGHTSDEDRKLNKGLFLDKNSGKDILISNPSSGGTGLNLQGECAYAIYYSNSYNAIHRWQSEDRIHRIGTYKTCHFIDLIASRTVDNRIQQNLRQKKDFSQLVLDDIRKMIFEAA